MAAACLTCEIFTLFDAAQVSYGERAYTALWPSVKNAFDVFVGVSLCFYFLRMIATGNAAFSEGVFQFLIYAFCAQTISSTAFFNDWIVDPVRTFMFNGAQVLMTQASVAGFSGDVSGVLRTVEANLLCVVNLGLQMIRDAGVFGLAAIVAAIIMGFPYLVALLLFLLLLTEVLVVLFIVKALGPLLIGFLAFKPTRSITKNGAKMLGQAAGAILITAALMGLMMGLLGTFMKWVPGSCTGGWRDAKGFIWSEGYIGLVLFGYFMLLMLLKAQGWAGQLIEFHGNSAAQLAGAAAVGKAAMTVASGAMGAAKLVGGLAGGVNPPSEWGRQGGQGGGGGGVPGLPGPGTPPPSIAPPSSSVKMLGNGPLDWQGPFPTGGGGRPSGGPMGGGPMIGGGGSPQLGGRAAALPAPARALPGPGGSAGPRQLGGPTGGPAAPGSAASPAFRQAAVPSMVGTGGMQGMAGRGVPAASGAAPGASAVGSGASGRTGDMGGRGAEASGGVGSRGDMGSRGVDASGGVGSRGESGGGATMPAGTGAAAAAAGTSGRGGDLASGAAGGASGVAPGVQRAGGYDSTRGNVSGAGPAGHGSGTEGQPGRDGAGGSRGSEATGDGGRGDTGRGFASPRVAPQGPRAGGGGYGARITNGVGVAEVIPPRGAPVRSQYTRRWR